MAHGPQLVYASECPPCRVIARLLWALSWFTFTLVPDPHCPEPALAFRARRLTGRPLRLAMTALVLVDVMLMAAAVTLALRAADLW